MNFTIHNVDQRTPEWFALRAGKLTGSVAKDVLASVKSGEAAARRDLRYRLVCERLTGLPQEDGFVNDAMQRGIDLEPKARAAYEGKTGQLVHESGFITLDGLHVGCSLDGHLSGFEALVSIKCPKTSTHLGYLKDREMPSTYYPQMWHECWVTGARNYIFVSYDDRLPERFRLFVADRKVTDDEVESYAAKAQQFLAEVDQELAALDGLEVA